VDKEEGEGGYKGKDRDRQRIGFRWGIGGRKIG
jgi:hypothetical protein